MLNTTLEKNIQKNVDFCRLELAKRSEMVYNNINSLINSWLCSLSAANRRFDIREKS